MCWDPLELSRGDVKVPADRCGFVDERSCCIGTWIDLVEEVRSHLRTNHGEFSRLYDSSQGIFCAVVNSGHHKTFNTILGEIRVLDICDPDVGVIRIDTNNVDIISLIGAFSTQLNEGCTGVPPKRTLIEYLDSRSQHRHGLVRHHQWRSLGSSRC